MKRRNATASTATIAGPGAPLAMPRRGDLLLQPEPGEAPIATGEPRRAMQAAHRYASAAGHLAHVCERSIECSRCSAAGAIAPTAKGWALRGIDSNPITAVCSNPVGDRVWIEPALQRPRGRVPACSFRLARDVVAFAWTGSSRRGATVHQLANGRAREAWRVRLYAGTTIEHDASGDAFARVDGSMVPLAFGVLPWAEVMAREPEPEPSAEPERRRIVSGGEDAGALLLVGAAVLPRVVVRGVGELQIADGRACRGRTEIASRFGDGWRVDGLGSTEASRTLAMLAAWDTARAAWSAIEAEPERLATWAACTWIGRLASAGGAS